MRNLLLFLITASIAWAADAAVYYAAPGGGAAASCVDSGANVCTVDRARVVAGNGDTVILVPGTYPSGELGSAGYLMVSSENISWRCAVNKQCRFLPAGANVSGIRMNTPTTSAVVFEGIVIDGSVGSPMDQCFYFSDGTALYTVEIDEVECREPMIGGIRIVANELAITVTDSDMFASSRVTPRSYLYNSATYAEGSITIRGGVADIAQFDDAGTAVVDIFSADAGQTASITGMRISVSSDGTITSGNHNGIVVRNMPDVVIDKNDITILGNHGTVGALGIICYSSAALSSARCRITENTVRLGTTTGQALSVGWDQTGAGDGQSAGGLIRENRVECLVDGTNIHAAGLFWSNGGVVTGNYLKNCGIGLLSKDQPVGGSFYGNIVDGFWGMGLYNKASASPLFQNNTLVSRNSDGTPVILGKDGATNATNTRLLNNSFISVGGQPSLLIVSASGQTLAEASNNNWYGFTNPVWQYLGTSYSSLAAWNAVSVVGTDYMVDPGVLGGTSPRDIAGLTLRKDSLLCNLGKYAGPAKMFDGRDHVRAVGAFECERPSLRVTR